MQGCPLIQWLSEKAGKNNSRCEQIKLAAIMKKKAWQCVVDQKKTFLWYSSSLLFRNKKSGLKIVQKSKFLNSVFFDQGFQKTQKQRFVAYEMSMECPFDLKSCTGEVDGMMFVHIEGF